MTPDTFRSLALGQMNARLASRLGTIEFLIGDKVFAALGVDPGVAMVRLSPEDQARALAAAPAVFSPHPGGAGARGVTCVRLGLAQDHQVKPVLVQAAGRARNARSALTRLS
jgi:hypothetical protein